MIIFHLKIAGCTSGANCSAWSKSKAQSFLPVLGNPRGWDSMWKIILNQLKEIGVTRPPPSLNPKTPKYVIWVPGILEGWNSACKLISTKIKMSEKNGINLTPHPNLKDSWGGHHKLFDQFQHSYEVKSQFIILTLEKKHITIKILKS